MTARITDVRTGAGLEDPASPPAWTKLGTVNLGVDGTTMGPVSWAAWGINYELLMVQGRIVGYSNLDRPLMTFNGVATGYTDRWLMAAAAVGTFTNGETASSAGIRWAGTDVMTGRVVTCLISNGPNEKRVILEDMTGSGSAATQNAHHHLGQGTWVNNALITSVSVATLGGRNFTAGSGFAVWGARSAAT